MKKIFQLNPNQAVEVDVPEALEFDQFNRHSMPITPSIPLKLEELEIGQELFLVSDCYEVYNGYVPMVHDGAVIKDMIQSEEGDKILLVSTQDDKYFKKGQEREVLLSEGGFGNYDQEDLNSKEWQVPEMFEQEAAIYWFGYIHVYASKEAWNQAMVSSWEEKRVKDRELRKKVSLRQQIKDELDQCSMDKLETILSYMRKS